METENSPSSDDPGGPDRRDFLKKCGTFAAVTPPAITMLLSTSLTSKAIAKSGRGGGSPRTGNNGVGNGYDPQPRGNPPINDGLGTSPGNPGNRGGKK
jgi:hypothetical protein